MELFAQVLVKARPRATQARGVIRRMVKRTANVAQKREGDSQRAFPISNC